MAEAEREERFRVLYNRRSGFWEVRETVGGRRSLLRARRLTEAGAQQAQVTLYAQVREREAAGRR